MSSTGSCHRAERSCLCWWGSWTKPSSKIATGFEKAVQSRSKGQWKISTSRWKPGSRERHRVGVLHHWKEYVPVVSGVSGTPEVRRMKVAVVEGAVLAGPAGGCCWMAEIRMMTSMLMRGSQEALWAAVDLKELRSLSEASVMLVGWPSQRCQCPVPRRKLEDSRAGWERLVARVVAAELCSGPQTLPCCLEGGWMSLILRMDWSALDGHILVHPQAKLGPPYGNRSRWR